MFIQLNSLYLSKQKNIEIMNLPEVIYFERRSGSNGIHCLDYQCESEVKYIREDIIAKNKKPENPNAFPGMEVNGNFFKEGMTLRDYFAAKAMQGYLSSHAHPEASNPLNGIYDEMAKEAYQIADAMLKQREL